MLESDIEDYLVRRVKAKGGEIRKVKWIGRRGAPDRLVAMPDWYAFVELKRPGAVPEAHQLREHERMRDMGLRVEVVDSLAKVDQLVDTGFWR